SSFLPKQVGPRPSTTSEAAAEPTQAHHTDSFWRKYSVKKPPTKTSPAPVGSTTTCEGQAAILYCAPSTESTEPLAPMVTMTVSTPKSWIAFIAGFSSDSPVSV